MFFTKDDYRRIEEWLSHRVTEKIALGNASIQGNGTGKSYGREVHIYSPDFYNVTLNAGKGYISLDEAVTLVPQDMRIFGLAITFLDEGGVWRIYQFAGLTFAQWDDITYWQSPYSADLEGLIPDVDNEDLCFVTQQGRKYIRLKDRQFSNLEFIDRGYQIVRRNRIAVGDGWTNRLVNEMVCCPNTIYDLRYNYDLGGTTVKMPEGCVIDFNGGMLHNGTMELNGTGLLGVWELADMGDVSWTGTFKTGQVMTFLNEEASTLTGEYFVLSTRESSSDEDGVDDTETYYAVNEEAWTTEERQELWWWNGEEWVKILDQTDYDTLYAIIEDVIEKIDYEMEACYAYFRTRIYNLECRVDECENQISLLWEEVTNIWNTIEEIQEEINNIWETIYDIQEEITNIWNTIEDIQTDIDNINNKIENLEETVNNFSSGDTVSISNRTTSGTRIVTITVNGTAYDIYAPESESSGIDGDELETLVSYSAEVTSGTLIGYLVVNGNKTAIYAPTASTSSGGSTVTWSGEIDEDTDNSYEIGTLTIDGTKYTIYGISGSGDVSVTALYTTGTHIATINGTKIYCPNDGSGSTSGYTLPVATDTTLGGVMVDGEQGIKITSTGMLSADVDYITTNIDWTDVDINSFNWSDFDITNIESQLNSWLYGAVTPVATSGNVVATIDCGDAGTITLYSGPVGESSGSGDCYWYLDGTNLYAGTSTTASYAAYATAFYESSDVHLKRAIDDINNTDLKKVETVRLRQFIMGDDFKYGVIAQELEKAGLDNLVKINKDGYRSVDYIAFLILRIEALERKVKRYEQELLERSDQDAD